MSTHVTRTIVRMAIAAGVIAALAPLAGAALILPGQTLFTVAEPDPVGGGIVAGGVPVPFASGTYTGTLTSTVLIGDASNPFGPGALTFTYLLTNDPTSPESIQRLTTNGFAGFATDVSYQPGPGQVPTFDDRSALAGGNVVGFTFFGVPIGAGPLLPGQTSTLLVIQTNSTTFLPSYSSVIDGSVTSVASFAPIPEPATLALLAIGAIGLVIRRRGRK